MDGKGRVTLPARFRDWFEAGAYLARMPGKEPAVRVYTQEGWQDFEERNIERLDEFNQPEDRDLQRSIYANLAFVEPDKQNRVLVPSQFIEELGLSGKILIIGNRTHLELWDPDTYSSNTGGKGTNGS